MRRVVLDLRELEFMDSSGLRTGGARGAAAGRRGALARADQGPGRVQRVFAITRMEDHLTFVDGPEALDSDEAAA